MTRALTPRVGEDKRKNNKAIVTARGPPSLPYASSEGTSERGRTVHAEAASFLAGLTEVNRAGLETRHGPGWFNWIFTETLQGSLTGFYFKSQEVPENPNKSLRCSNSVKNMCHPQKPGTCAPSVWSPGSLKEKVGKRHEPADRRRVCPGTVSRVRTWP